VSILFQATCADVDGTVVRYEWFFGDGTAPDYHVDTNHVFRFPATYTVTLVCTDDDGAQGSTSQTLTLE
jgi:PKD repeat protein